MRRRFTCGRVSIFLRSEVRVELVGLLGDHDFVPVAIANPVAAALPWARPAVLPACRHFAYLETSEAVHSEVAALLPGA